jgi:hypothetical protein
LIGAKGEVIFLIELYLSFRQEITVFSFCRRFCCTNRINPPLKPGQIRPFANTQEGLSLPAAGTGMCRTIHAKIMVFL